MVMNTTKGGDIAAVEAIVRCGWAVKMECILPHGGTLGLLILLRIQAKEGLATVGTARWSVTL
jgi:hypothetical protein